MKEWIMKHPILTFLMVAGIASELFDTIRAFAPKTEDIPKEKDPEANLTVQIETNKEESK